MQIFVENPSEWGYDISPETGYLVPSTYSSNVQPFRVHLFGGVEKGLRIPPELEEHVLVFRRGLNYVDYYRELSKLVRGNAFPAVLQAELTLMRSSAQDLVLPILGNDEYIKNRATAAFPAGVISRVPSLVTPSLLKSYNYLEPPAAGRNERSRDPGGDAARRGSVEDCAIVRRRVGFRRRAVYAESPTG